MACVLAVGLLGIAPAAAADVRGPRYVKPSKIVKADVTKIRVYGRGVKIHAPVGPASVYCEYPYYYSRGHYPTHIGGYVYYPNYYQRTC
jgi:hypothetical protein